MDKEDGNLITCKKYERYLYFCHKNLLNFDKLITFAT